jgi:hypothetical protein
LFRIPGDLRVLPSNPGEFHGLPGEKFSSKHRRILAKFQGSGGRVE